MVRPWLEIFFGATSADGQWAMKPSGSATVTKCRGSMGMGFGWANVSRCDCTSYKNRTLCSNLVGLHSDTYADTHTHKRAQTDTYMLHVYTIGPCILIHAHTHTQGPAKVSVAVRKQGSEERQRRNYGAPGPSPPDAVFRGFNLPDMKAFVRS